MAKKALVVVSFGTTYPDALRSIEAVEERLRQECPDRDFFRAFTSGMVIAKLRRTRGLEIETPEELLDRLAGEGYGDILCQSTHVMSGVEYDKMRTQLKEKAPLFGLVQLGSPLLSKKRDFEECCEPVLRRLPAPLAEDEALVLMGHGTDHFANAAYSQLENTFRYLGHERVYVGTVEGFPGLDYVLDRLKRRDVRRVYLMPFMIVAGDHAQNDLAGEDGQSWKSICEARGYAVTPLLYGLGGMEEIGEIFARHLNDARLLAGENGGGKKGFLCCENRVI